MEACQAGAILYLCTIYGLCLCLTIYGLLFYPSWLFACVPPTYLGVLALWMRACPILSQVCWGAILAAANTKTIKDCPLFMEYMSINLTGTRYIHITRTYNTLSYVLHMDRDYPG